ISGPVYLGLLITPGPSDTDTLDKSGVHRGEDWETLTVVTPVPGGGTDLSAADPTLNTRAEGTLTTPAQVDTYSFTGTAAQGSGSLSATVTPAGGAFVPRLTLSGPGGTLIQSDSGTLTQVLLPGSYSLAVSSQSGTGSYQLTTAFVPSSPALQSS